MLAWNMRFLFGDNIICSPLALNNLKKTRSSMYVFRPLLVQFPARQSGTRRLEGWFSGDFRMRFFGRFSSDFQRIFWENPQGINPVILWIDLPIVELGFDDFWGFSIDCISAYAWYLGIDEYSGLGDLWNIGSECASPVLWILYPLCWLSFCMWI